MRWRRCVSQIDPEYLDRTRNVLDLLRAEVFEAEAQFVQNLVANDSTRANSTGFGQRLEPRGNVDAVAEDIVAIDDDVADIDADAKIDPQVRGHSGIALGHA